MNNEKSESRLDSAITIRRSNILEDSLVLLKSKQKIGKLRVEFVSDQGHLETGIDGKYYVCTISLYSNSLFIKLGGGLFKEYVNTALNAAFDTRNGFFLATAEQWLVS